MATVDRVSPDTRSPCTCCAAGVPTSRVSAMAPTVWCPSLPQAQVKGHRKAARTTRQRTKGHVVLLDIRPPPVCDADGALVRRMLPSRGAWGRDAEERPW